VNGANICCAPCEWAEKIRSYNLVLKFNLDGVGHNHWVVGVNIQMCGEVYLSRPLSPVKLVTFVSRNCRHRGARPCEVGELSDMIRGTWSMVQDSPRILFENVGRLWPITSITNFIFCGGYRTMYHVNLHN